MKGDRITRVNERILQELSSGIYRLNAAKDIDLARLSFVSVNTAPDLHNAYVVVSVIGTDEEARKYLSWLRKNRADLQKHLAVYVGLKYTPILSFSLTHAIESGNRVLNILDSLPGLSDEESEEIRNS